MGGGIWTPSQSHVAMPLIYNLSPHLKQVLCRQKASSHFCSFPLARKSPLQSEQMTMPVKNKMFIHVYTVINGLQWSTVSHTPKSIMARQFYNYKYSTVQHGVLIEKRTSISVLKNIPKLYNHNLLEE